MKFKKTKEKSKSKSQQMAINSKKIAEHEKKKVRRQIKIEELIEKILPYINFF